LKSRTAKSDKNTNSCPKTFNKAVTGYIFYHISKILQTNKKTRKINLFNAIPKNNVLLSNVVSFLMPSFPVNPFLFLTLLALSHFFL